VTRRLATALLCAALGACTSAGFQPGFDTGRLLRWPGSEHGPAQPELREGDGSGLPAPLGLRAASGELREIPLRWDPLLDENVGGYALERSPEREGVFERIAILSGRNATVYVDLGSDATAEESDSEAGALPDGETFFYRVRAFGRDGELAPASEVVAATTAPLPDPPSGLRAWSHRPREVPLGWEPSPSPHVGGYVIERSPAEEGPFSEVGRVEDRWQSTWIDAGLGDLRVFYYRIAAFNRAGGRGRATEPVRAVTKPDPLPPIGLRVVERRLGENRLAWEPNVETDLVGYRLLRVRDGEEAAETVAEPGADVTQAVDTGVGAGEVVSYRLVALDRDGLESTESHPVRVESEGYDLAATPRADGVELAWNPRSEEGYRVARVMLEGWLDDRELAAVEGAVWVHRGVRPGQRYRYHVVLETADGRAAPPSATVEVRVPDA
jgi:hypothetical protein